MLTIQLQYSGSRFLVRNRHIGGLTGSRTAVALARVPIEHMISSLNNSFLENAFLGKVSIGVYVDNLFSVSNSVSGAIQQLEICATYLA